jgi:hypothetical protein
LLGECAMTSVARIAANRKNGACGGGPRTATGKARSSRNALRHGLTVNILHDSAVRPEAEELAEAIAGPNVNSARLAEARTIAEALVVLFRIRDAQVKLMDSACPAPLMAPEVTGQEAFSAEALQEVLPQLARWHDYERKVLSRLKRAMREFLFLAL